ncbi:MAG TPA: cytochrome c3 family protein [Candidatus Deferrimicrobiaceae bacterium]
MMRKAAFWAALFVAVAFLTGTTFAAAPDNVLLKGKTKAPVFFTHKAHGEKFLVGCAKCHHNNSEGKEQKCSACHGPKTVEKKLALKEAFHTQCKGCHEKQKKGPVKCVACHKAKKK